MLEVRGLSRRGVLENISFTVRAGEVVALAGLVGAGRTEIARCLFGADAWSAGEMRLEGVPFVPKSPHDAIAAGIGFVTEDRKEQGVVLNLTVRENVSLASLSKVSRLGFVRRGAENAEARESVQRLRVRTPSVEQKVGNLSGGNQQKVILAKWLQIPLKLLILDEPTRGIDCRGEARDLPDHERACRAGRRHPDDLLRAARGAGHGRPHRGRPRRPRGRDIGPGGGDAGEGRGAGAGGVRGERRGRVKGDACLSAG